jgi:hypothetical protein
VLAGGHLAGKLVEEIQQTRPDQVLLLGYILDVSTKSRKVTF